MLLEVLVTVASSRGVLLADLEHLAVDVEDADLLSGGYLDVLEVGVPALLLVEDLEGDIAGAARDVENADLLEA